jgi:DNA primase
LQSKLVASNFGTQNKTATRKYIRERKLTANEVAEWQLGWSGTDWRFITPAIINANLFNAAEKLGIVKRSRNDDSNYDGFDQFSTPLHVYLPSYWLKSYQYKTEIPKCNIIYLNKHFEEKFEEELCRHCFLLNLFGIEIKEALENFCKRHNIEIEEDITFEALKKKEYRERKKLEEKLSKPVLPVQP